MSGRALRSLAIDGLPPLLVRLIHALQEEGPKGHAETLAALGRYALVAVPQRGVFAPHDGDAYLAIERIALEHLGFKQGKQVFAEALQSLSTFDERDRIESAQNEYQALSDEAYYYLGLAFGVTLAALADPF
jgi:hypothetical protein